MKVRKMSLWGVMRIILLYSICVDFPQDIISQFQYGFPEDWQQTLIRFFLNEPKPRPKRGRKKGSKNKKKHIGNGEISLVSTNPVVKRGRGRPRKIRVEEEEESIPSTESTSTETSIIQDVQEWNEEMTIIADEQYKMKETTSSVSIKGVSMMRKEENSLLQYVNPMNWKEDDHAIEHDIILPWKNDTAISSESQQTLIPTLSESYKTLNELDSLSPEQVYSVEHEYENVAEMTLTNVLTHYKLSSLCDQTPECANLNDSSSSLETEIENVDASVKSKEKKRSRKSKQGRAISTLKKWATDFWEEIPTNKSFDEIQQTRSGRYVFPPMEYWRHSLKKRDTDNYVTEATTSDHLEPKSSDRKSPYTMIILNLSFFFS
jgi:hypothetical protein